MDCNRARELLFLIVDDEVGVAESEALKAHVSGCQPCSRRVVFTRRLVTVVRERCVRREAPDHLRLRILDSLRQRQPSS
jgi:mycothiol system anti-sigma-R factor